MMNLQKKILDWSPCMLLDTIQLDSTRSFLRNSFFKTLLDPYIDYKNKNYRFDLLDSVRSTNFLS